MPEDQSNDWSLYRGVNPEINEAREMYLTILLEHWHEVAVQAYIAIVPIVAVHPGALDEPLTFVCVAKRCDSGETHGAG